MTLETYDNLKQYVGNNKDNFTDDLLNMGYTKGHKQGRADIIDELYNKIDEGVCDICEHKDFESDCFKTCNFELENAKKWLLSLKEQKCGIH